MNSLKRTLLLGSLGIGLFWAVPLQATPNFTSEAGIRLSSATPQDWIQTSTTSRLFFIRDYAIYAATSTDGLTWHESSEPEISTATTPSLDFSSVTAAAVLTLDDGGFRMLYTVINATGSYQIRSATSSSGSGWANDNGMRFENDDRTFLGSLKLTELSDGQWRVYYVEDSNGGNEASDYRIYSRVSSDQGLTWGAKTLVIDEQVGEIALSTRTDAARRILYTAPLSGGTSNTQLLSQIATGSNGSAFSSESGVRFSTGSSAGQIIFPLTVRSTDSFRWRLYYSFVAAGSSIPYVYSAITADPDPRSISPSTVYRTDPARQFTIGGEVFSTSPTLLLRKSGETDVTGTSITRSNDQTITVTFDLTGKALGLWDLVVTNSDGRSTTYSNALYINFAPGVVVLTDNLFRPLKGGRLQIDITVFNPGHTKIRVLTLEGREINTVVDQTLPLGTSTFYWNGTSSNGQVVASGTYILDLSGPGLDRKLKVVVVK